MLDFLSAIDVSLLIAAGIGALLGMFAVGVLAWYAGRRAYNLKYMKTVRDNPEWGATFWQSYSASLWSVVVSAVFFTLIFALVVLFVEKRQSEQMLMKTLTIQLGSPINATAIDAARELQLRGWHNNGVLHGALLWRANLENADLYGFDLEDTHFMDANFDNAYLWCVNFENADLSGATFYGADLRHANLKGAILESPEFGVAQFDTTTLLPDRSN